MNPTRPSPFPDPARPGRPRRRALTALGAAAATVMVGRVRARPVPAAMPLPEALAAAVAAFTGGADVRPGRVTLDVAQLVDNGNAVPMTVSVDSRMTGDDRVEAIAVFNERNPQREVIQAVFGPRAGAATLATRIRLATSQKLVAVARFADGNHWAGTVDVVVTLAACIEGETG